MKVQHSTPRWTGGRYVPANMEIEVPDGSTYPQGAIVNGVKTPDRALAKPTPIKEQASEIDELKKELAANKKEMAELKAMLKGGNQFRQK